jgi:hypothetical protein
MTHHALLLEGTYEWALTCLPETCRVEGSDSAHYRGARMGIDEVRRVIAAAYQTPLHDTHRHFILAFDEFTHEAQNALLKLLEEPPQTARFYIVTRSKGVLLPTLLSRLLSSQTEYVDETDAPEKNDEQTFFAASYSDRLAEVASRATKKDDVWMGKIMDAIEAKAEETKNARLMRAVVDLRPVFGMPGASKKMILEHLSLLF